MTTNKYTIANKKSKNNNREGLELKLAELVVVERNLSLDFISAILPCWSQLFSCVVVEKQARIVFILLK